MLFFNYGEVFLLLVPTYFAVSGDFNFKCMKRTTHTPNEVINCGDYCEIVLYNKRCKEVARALIDTEDINKVETYKWCLNNWGYIKTTYKEKAIFLHYLIMGKPPKGLGVDHINHNPLDNRKANLRFVTKSQNQMNRKVKGIYWNKNGSKWQAQIHVNNKQIYLGLFVKEQDALKARKQAEIKYFGEHRYKKW